MGYLVALTGPRLAAIYPAAGMVVVLAFLFARSASGATPPKGASGVSARS